MKVIVLEYPTDADWMAAKQRALVTAGLSVKNPPDFKWKRDSLEARHSHIRRLRFGFFIEDVPSWVSVHLCRHIHAQPYVRSQRPDRQQDYDRNKAPQDAPVDMIWDTNAEELMVIANKRLCAQASPETRAVVREICRQVISVCPEFDGLLVPMCEYHGNICHEMKPCGRYEKAVR